MNPAANIVFISYRRSDVGIAHALTELLRALGHSVFLDIQSIPLGKNWEAEILRAARAAQTMIVIWSRNAPNSRYMQREWEMAAADCRIIPIRLDGSELAPELAKRQALNLNVAERLLARIAELAAQGFPQKEATGRLISELRADGIELDARQKRAVDGAFGALVGFSLGSLFWLGRRSLHALIAPAGAAVVAGLGIGVFGLVHAKFSADELEQCKPSPVCPEPPFVHSNDGGDDPRPAPSLLPVFSPERLDLGRRAVGWNETITAALEITNRNATTLVLNPQAGGTGPPSLKVLEHNCRDLGPGASCQVKLKVGPTQQLFPNAAPIKAWVEAGGARTDVVGTLAPRAPVPIIPPTLGLTVQLKMLAKELGQAVGTNTLVVRNGSGGGLRVSDARIKAGTSFTIQSNGCKDVVLPAGSCPIEIEFKPRTLGQHRPGELELTLNTLAQRQVVRLAGKMLCTVPDLAAQETESDQVLIDAAAAAGFNLKFDVDPKKKSGEKVKFVRQYPQKGALAGCHDTMVARIERYDNVE